MDVPIEFWIGACLNSDGSSMFSNFTGYVDEIRISKGIARWTENFTPPTIQYGQPNTTDYVPEISHISNISTNEDSQTVIHFSVSDPDSTACAMAIEITSSDQSLIPDENISYDCYENNYTLTVSPNSDQEGIAAISIKVTDTDDLFAIQSFNMTVTGVNDLPTISQINDITILKNSFSVPFNVTVDDIDNTLDTLTLSVDTTNHALLPIENITIDGTGANRTISFTPTANETGALSMSVAVSDGSLTETQLFSILVKDVNDRSLYFDGISNYVDAGNQINLANTSFTIEFFAKKGTGNNGLCMISQGSLQENYLLDIGVYNNNHIRFGFFGENTIETDQAYPESIWHHMAFTFNHQSKEANIFIDGNHVKSGIFTSDFCGTGNIYIGQYATGGNRFQGEIDEVRIWNRALANTEIYANMCKGIRANTEGFIAYYPFSTVKSGITPDLTNMNVSAILINMTYQNWIASTAPIGDAFYMESGAGHIENKDIVPFEMTTNINLELMSLYSGIQILEKPGAADGLLNHYASEYLHVWFNDETNADNTMTYYYKHLGGITDENQLRIFKRSTANDKWQPADNISINNLGNNGDGIGAITIQNIVETSQYILTSDSNQNTFLDISPMPEKQVLEDCTITINTFEVFNASLPITFTAHVSDENLIASENITITGNTQNYSLTFKPEANMSGTCFITVTVIDSQGMTAHESFHVNVLPKNDLPIITSSPETLAIEDEFYAYTMTISDIDNDPISYSVIDMPSWLSINILPNKAIIFGTPNDADLLLPNYVNIQVSDSTVLLNHDYTITVFSVNDIPVLTGWAGQVTYTEDSSGVLISNHLTIEDNDNDTIFSASISISENYQEDQDILSFNNTTMISHSWDNDSGVLVLTGTDSVANYETAIQSIRYKNLSDQPMLQPRILSCLINDGIADSNIITQTILIVPLNDAPVLSSFDHTMTAIDEDDTDNQGNAIAYFVSLEHISDPDGNALTAIAVISVDQLNGQWQYSVDNGLSWSNISPLTQTSMTESVLLLDGTQSGANTNRIRFVPMPDKNGSSIFYIVAWDKTSGTMGNRVDLSGNDVFGGSNAFSTNFNKVTITIHPVNDLPINSDIRKSGNEDITLYFSTADFSSGYTDIDNDLLAKIKLIALPEHGVLRLDNQSVSIDTEISAIEMAQLSFVPDSDWYGETTLKWQASDGQAWALSPANAIISISSDPVDIDTVLKIGPEDLDLQFSAADLANFELDASSYIQAVSLPDKGTLLFDSEKTSQSHPFAGTPVTAGQTFLRDILLAGELVYRPEINFNGYVDFLWRASKNSQWSDNELVKITITPVNDPPTLDHVQQSTNEDSIVSLSVPVFVSGFRDIDGDSLDSIKLTCLPTHGALKISDTAVSIDTIISADNIANLSYIPDTNFTGTDTSCWSASDGYSYAESNAFLTITVLAVNDAPQIQLSEVSVTYTENEVPVAIAPNASIIDPDEADFDSGKLTLSIHDKTDSDALTIINQGTSLNEIWVQGNNISFTDDTQTQIIATFSINDNVLEITLNQHASLSSIAAVFRQLAFINMSDNPLTHPRSLELSLSDGDGGISESVVLTLTVIAINDAPVLNEIPDCTISEGTSLTTIQLSNYVIDRDNTLNEMTWTSVSAYPISLAIENNLARIQIQDENWNGEQSIKLIITDPSGLTDATLTKIIVLPVNDTPEVSLFADILLSEGQPFTSIHLDDFVTDIDNTNAEISWSVNENTSLTITIVNRIATITAPDENWNGSGVIEFIATDPDGLSHSASLQIIVTPVNDAPVIIPIPAIQMSEGDAYTQIHLNAFVSDIDNALQDISWSVSNAHPFTTSLSDDLLRIFPPDTDYYGSASVIIIASDPAGLTASKTINVDVLNINDPPKLSAIHTISAAEGSRITPLDLSQHVVDIDNDLAQLSWTTDISNVLTLTVSQNILYLTVVNENWNGSTAFSITVTDADGLSDHMPIMLIVLPVNDPPEMAVLPDISVLEGQSLTPIALLDYVSDSDNPVDQMQWSVQNCSHLTVTVSQHIAMIHPNDLNWNGQEILSIIAIDPEGLTSQSSLKINIVPVNDPPEILSIPEQSISEGNAFTPIHLDNFVFDIDNANSEITWSVSNTTLVSITITNRILSASPRQSEWNGSEYITLTASDPEGLTSQEIIIFTVLPQNDPPIIISIPETSATEDIHYAYTIIVNDVDGGALSYSVTRLPSWLTFNLENYGNVSTIAGAYDVPGDSGEGGPAKNSKIKNPGGCTFDRFGNLYFVDVYNHKIKKISADTGIIQTIAGTTQGFSGDNGDARIAQLSVPYNINMDSEGNIYVTEVGNHIIRKIHADTHMITTIAGNLTQDFSGDGGEPLDAALKTPYDVMLDALHNIFICDSGNNRLRTIDIQTGRINTISGGGSDIGDGDNALNARLSFPSGIVRDKEGNLYIADRNNHCIRRIDATTNIITSIAGNGTPGYSGDGQQASNAMIYSPGDLCIDAYGNIYIADNSNYRIRKIDSQTKIISTVAGKERGFVDNVSAENARFYSPKNIAIDNNGNLYVSEYSKHIIRKIEKLPPTLKGTPGDAACLMPNVVEIQVYDGIAYTTQQFTITVQNINDPPQINEIPDITISEGQFITDIPLDQWISDPDNEINEMKWSFSQANELSVTIANDIATINLPNVDYHGSETVKFIVADPEGLTDSRLLTFTVLPVNDSPQLTGTTLFKVKEGDSYTPIQLDDLVNDIDNNDADIEWTIQGTHSITITISQDRIVNVHALDENWNGSEILRFIATDPDGLTDTLDIVFETEAVNDTPEIINNTELIVSEGETITLSNLMLKASDIDDNDDVLLYKLQQAPANGSLFHNMTILNATNTFTQADIDNSTIHYQHSGNEFETDYFLFIVKDPSNAQTSEMRFDIVIISENDPPVLSGWGGTLSYTENDPGTVLSNHVSITDVDDLNIEKAVITIAENYQSEEDFLLFSQTSHISSHWETATGELILSGTASLEDYENAIASIQYKNLSDHPSVQQRTVSCMINDGYANSQTISQTVSIIAVNDRPVLSDLNYTLTSISEDHYTSAGDTISNLLSISGISDPDGSPVTAIVVTSVDNSAGVWQYSFDNGVSWINFTPLSNEMVYLNTNARLLGNTQTIRFVPDANFNGTSFFTFRLWDKTFNVEGESVSLTKVTQMDMFSINEDRADISVIPVNDIPTIRAFTKDGNEDAICYFTAADFVSHYTDIDQDQLSQIMITHLPENGNLRAQSIDISLSDTILISNIENLTFKPYTDWYGETHFEWKASDGKAWSLTAATVSIAIEADPVSIATISKTGDEDTDLQFDASDLSGFELDSTSYIQAVSLPAKGQLMFDSVKTSPSHPFSGTPVTQGQEFAINEILAGELIYRPEQNFNGYMEFFWRASKNNVWAPNELVKITILPVNDLPIITSINPSCDEDTPAFMDSADFNDAFSDDDGNILDRIKITCLPENGLIKNNGNSIAMNDEMDINDIALSYKPSDNFTGEDYFCWNGSDGDGYAMNYKMVTITVHPVNDSPMLELSQTSTVYTENAIAVTFANSASITDVDSPNFDTGILNVTITQNQTENDRLTIRNQGTANDEIAIDNQNIIFTDNNTSTTIGTFESLGTSLSVTFNANATQNAVSAVIRNLNFENISDKPALTSKSIRLVITDGDGGTSQAVDHNITIIPENDSPVVSSIPDQTITEGDSFTTIQLNNFVSDPDDTVNQMIWTTSGSTSLRVSIVNRVATVIIPDINYHGTETIQFTATDPGGLTDNTQVIYTVISVNDPPQISNIEGQTITEGESFTTIPLDNFMFDPDHTDDSIIWTVKGNSHLNTSFSNRVLTLLTPDNDWFGVENLEFIATDPDGLSISCQSVFTVLPVNDPPAIVSANESTEYTENHSHGPITSTLQITDIDNTMLTQASVTIAKHFIMGQEQLLCANPGNLDIETIENSSGYTLVLSGNDTIENYEVALNSVCYTYTGDDPDNLARHIAFTVYDAVASSNAHVISLSIIAFDDPPQLASPIDTLLFDEDAADETIQLAGLFNDPDNVDSNISKVLLSHSNPSLLSAHITDNELVLQFHDNQHGEASLVVQGLSNGKSIEETISITVNPVNDPLILAHAIQNIIVDEDAAITEIVLDHVFSDIDKDDLSIIKDIQLNSNEALLSAMISDNTLTLEFNPNKNGEATIIVRAYSDGETSDNIFTVTVNAVDDPPTVKTPLETIIVDEDSQRLIISITDLFTDCDNDDASISKSLSSCTNDDLFFATLTKDFLTLDFHENAFGNASLIIMGKSNGKAITHAVDIIVNQLDDPPFLLSAVEDIDLFEDADSVSIDLTNVFSDQDNDDALIVKSLLSNTNPDLLTVTVQDNTLTIQLFENQSGEAIVTIQALSDSETITDSFLVSVYPVDDPPALANSLSDITRNEDDPTVVIPIDQLFVDIDSVITKTLEISSTSDFFGSTLTEDNLEIAFKENQSGIASITILGSADGKLVQDSFILTVNPVNDPPIFTTTPVQYAVEGVQYIYDFLAYDIEEDPISYAAPVLPSWLSLETESYGNIYTVAGSGRRAFCGDGMLAKDACFYYPRKMTVDKQGNLYIAESSYSYYYIYKVDALTSKIEIIAGNGEYGFAADGELAKGSPIDQVDGMAVASNGDVYVSTYRFHCIRKIEASSGKIYTVVGKYNRRGNTGDNVPAQDTLLYYPTGIAFDKDDNLYIADQRNSRVRKLDKKTNMVSIVAGCGGRSYRGDGGLAVNAYLYYPMDVAVDKIGNVFIMDAGNKVIRKVDASTGIISTYAGNRGYYNSRSPQNNVPALSFRMGWIDSIDVDPEGNVFIAHYPSSSIYMIDSESKMIQRIAGTYKYGFRGDDGPAINAYLRSPMTLAVDQKGNIFISDTGNCRIRKVEHFMWRITGTPDTNAVNADNLVRIEAFDGTASTFQEYTISVISKNLGPTIAEIPSQTINEGASFTPIVLDNYVSDPDHSRDQINWTCSNDENILVEIINRLAVITLLNENWTGSKSISFVAEDPTGLVDSIAVSFTVNALNDPPEILSEPVLQAIAGMKYTYDIDAYDQDYEKINVTIESAPAWLSMEQVYSDPHQIYSFQYGYVRDLEIDQTGKKIYIPEYSSNIVSVLDIASNKLSIIAGTGDYGNSSNFENNVPATKVSLGYPYGINLDKDGNVYIAEINKYCISKVDIETGMLSIVAGTGSYGFSGDGYPATLARLKNPYDVMVGSEGTIYINDRGNYRIRIVDPNDKIIRTIKYFGSREYVLCMGVDSSDNAWILTYYYYYRSRYNFLYRYNIQKNTFERVAGNSCGFSGDGNHYRYARYNNPSSMSIDPLDNIYIADTRNRRIRKISSDTGIIQTVISEQICNMRKIYNNQTNQFSPYAITVDLNEHIYIVDNARNLLQFKKVFRLSGTPQLSDIGKNNQVVLNVSDGKENVLQTFEISISDNAPPSISFIEDQNTAQGEATQRIPFTINDIDNASNQLTVRATSGNLSLISDDQIHLYGNDAQRTIEIVPDESTYGQISITVHVSDGEKTTAESFMLTIHARPYASIGIADNYTTCAATPLPVMFTPTNIMHDVTSWLWDFGDGNTSTERNPEHMYFLNAQADNPSKYTVSLTVSGPGGTSSETRSEYIIVNDRQQVDFTSNVRTGMIPQTVLFFDASLNVPGSYLWDFGDGNQSSTAYATSHTYTAPGMYTVTLSIGDRSKSKSNYIQVEGRRINGHVYSDDNGNALSGFYVELLKNNKTIASTTTDANGEYIFQPLASTSNYIVGVWPPLGNKQYYYQYYSGAKKPYLATKVSTVSSDRDNIDVFMEKRPLSGISGQVRIFGGSPVYGIDVSAFSTQQMDSMRTTTDENGHYTLVGLDSSDDYLVYVWYESYQSEFYHKTSQESVVNSNKATVLTPGTPILENIDIIIRKGGTISGTVKNNNINLLNVWVSAWSEILQTGNGALSNEFGEYTISGLTGNSNGQDVTYIVEVQPLKYPYQVYDQVVSRSQASPVLVDSTGIDFNLKMGNFIFGKVKNTDDEPVNLASIVAVSKTLDNKIEVFSDFSGQYSLTNLKPADDYQITVYAMGYINQVHSDTFDVRVSGITEVNFTLDKGPYISGTVYIDDIATPAPQGIWVNVWSEETQTGGESVTDENGMYEVTGLDSSATDYVISIHTNGYMPAFYHLDGTVYQAEGAGTVAASQDTFDIVLKSGYYLYGNVLFENKDLSNVRIEAWAEDINCWTSTTSSDSLTKTYNYLLQGLLPGTYELTFKADLYLTQNLNNIVIDNEDIEVPDVTMERFDRRLSGTVAGVDKDQSISIYAWSDNTQAGDFVTLLGSGSDMVYSIAGLKPASDYLVQLSSSNLPSQYYHDKNNWVDADKVDLSTNDINHIDFNLNIDTASISGNVIFPQGATPGDTVNIDAISTSKELKQTTRVIYSGSSTVAYSLSGVEKTAYVIYAHSSAFKRLYYDQQSDFDTATVVDMKNSDSVNDINFTLAFGANISGQITDDFGNGLPDIRVEAASDMTNSFGFTKSGDSGVYAIAGLDDASDFRVSAIKSGSPPFYYHTENSVRNKADASLINTMDMKEHTQINISLAEGQTISGTVSSLDGKPVAGVWVTASSDIHNIQNSERTDDVGFYNISGLTPGHDYTIFVSPACNSLYVPDHKSNVSTNSGRINFYLSEGFELSGYVTAQSTGAPVNDVTIKIQSTSTNYHCESKTDTRGYFQITGMPQSDDYQVKAFPSSGSNYQNEIYSDIQVSDNLALNFSLKSAGYFKGYVYEKDSQVPVYNAQIKIYSKLTSYSTSTRSDNTGYYQIDNIPDALDYEFTISHDNYVEFIKTGNTAGSEITFYLNNNVGEISGEVIDENGTPFSDALIKVRSLMLGIKEETFTDLNGQYRISNLPSENNGVQISDYRVFVEADGYPLFSKGEKSVGDIVNFQLERSESNQITGKVHDAIDQVLPENSYSVIVFVYEEGSLKSTTKVAKDGTGLFIITGLTPDKAYKLLFRTSSPDMDKEWLGPNNQGLVNIDDAIEVYPGQAIHFKFSKGIW